MTTPTITTWRDLSNRLTPEQRDRFAEREPALEGPPDAVRELLLMQARHHAEGNRRDREHFGHSIDYAWHGTRDFQTGEWSRELEGSRWAVDGL